MAKCEVRDPIYRPASLSSRNHRALRSLVSHVSPQLSRPRSDDGRARDCGLAHNHLALAPAFVPEYERRWGRYARPRACPGAWTRRR
jgi:hypothetical protein